jgi:hypothetical protein
MTPFERQLRELHGDDVLDFEVRQEGRSTYRRPAIVGARYPWYVKLGALGAAPLLLAAMLACAGAVVFVAWISFTVWFSPVAGDGAAIIAGIGMLLLAFAAFTNRI